MGLGNQIRNGTAALILGLAAPHVAVADITYGKPIPCQPNGVEHRCEVGNRVEDRGFSTELWVPFDTKDPFIWVADACLGYFVTRQEAALNAGVQEPDGPGNFYVTLGKDKARLHILNFPTDRSGSDNFGVFYCHPTSWPELTLWPAELDRWIASRLTASSGWWDIREQKGDTFNLVHFRNERMGVEIKVYQIGLAPQFQLEADYFGPPIVVE